ncbi:AraC family transcriptional regulator [Pantoea phytobeneficialis]|uniref:AraC family transcriptional regulator n=1 Tax=Pantoea phytobeneficialis TaxID=2052056 RepID=A0ABT8XZA1_9GAMM|nr:AraC family transcriptional regulator [Pantoea phytobeneficialis]MDO6408766.1 AraC family transcriptional regulator [Pantoea phytobeneficialis]
MPLFASEWFARNGIECSRVTASDSAFPRHLHDEYVVCANLSGREAIWLDGKSYEAQAGQVTVYNPTSVQASQFSVEPVSFISVHLPQSVLAGTPALREGAFHHSPLFAAICDYADATRQHDEGLQEQQLMWLCGELLDDSASRHQGDAQLMVQVKEYLRANLSSKPQLATLAQQVGLSKYHLVRRFTQLTGMPPLQYHMQLRLHHARELLRRGVHAQDAALQLGFYDQSHFINAFRKVMGTTPHHYAHQLRINSR